MSLSRLRSMREKRSSINKKDKPRLFSGDLYGNDDRSRKSTSSGSSKAMEKTDDSNVVVNLLWDLQSLLASAWETETINRVLHGRYANGDPDKALELLVIIEDSNDGIVARVRREGETKLLGAENNGGVTCYLDTLLFAMFARLDAFEAILYNSFDETNEAEKKRGRLAALIRLFVNLLRQGKLVTTDIMSQLQQSISECGWKEASSNQQQDPSEAFVFITDTLQLPLLTVKVDIAHGGEEVAEDDHKFVSERLLNLSLPPKEGDSGVSIPLEACLEEYFHGRVDVRRQLERRGTIDSVHSFEKSYDDSKGKSLHVETSDLGSQPTSPIATPQTPIIPQLVSEKSDASGPSTGRPRKQSLMRTVEVENEIKLDGGGRKRAMTLRKEMLLPAWCFFSVLPFYTDSSPQPARSTFAEHFSSRRPVLGLCLKRYSWTVKDGAQRDPRRVDIPLEIALPTFVTDDEMGEDDGRLYGNFKLVLQSAICHRGTSVNSGHYIALVRGDEGRWLRFDDLALSERVTTVNHKTAFEEDDPYMLFYQVQPLEDDETVVSNTAPPSVHSFEDMSEKRRSIISSASTNTDSFMLPPEPTINEPPSYENHQTAIEFGTSPPPPYVGGGFLSLPEPDTPERADNGLLRPSSRSMKRPGSRDGDSIAGNVVPEDTSKAAAAAPTTTAAAITPRRSKSEVADKRSSWASLRLGSMTRGKSQDKLGVRKSGEWRNEDYQNASARVSEDNGERIDPEKEKEKEKGKGKGKEKERESSPKEKRDKEKEREMSPKEKKDKGKGKEKNKDKNKKEVRECIIM